MRDACRKAASRPPFPTLFLLFPETCFELTQRSCFVLDYASTMASTATPAKFFFLHFEYLKNS
jgi:hypothetical protein